MNSIEYWDQYLEDLAQQQVQVNQQLSSLYEQALHYGVDMNAGFETKHLDVDLKRQLQQQYGVNIDNLVSNSPQEKTFSNWIMKTRAVRV